MSGYITGTGGQNFDAAADWVTKDRKRRQEIGVDLLESLSNGGSVLELGVGTGRVALSLAARGVTVHGVDASRAMVRTSVMPQPAPIGRMRQHDPGGPPQGAREVGHARAHTHHHIHPSTQSGGIAHVVELIRHDTHGGCCQCGLLFGSNVLLQTHVIETWRQMRDQGRSIDAAKKIIFMPGVAPPDHPHAGTLLHAQTGLPVTYLGRR